MRLHPPAYIIGRQATRDVTLGGVKVPTGRVVLLNVAGMQRRSDLFEDPDRFDLDRLSVENEKKLRPLSYMPFGAGPRVCIGNHFALMESHVVLATMMQHVRFELEERSRGRLRAARHATTEGRRSRARRREDRRPELAASLIRSPRRSRCPAPSSWPRSLSSAGFIWDLGSLSTFVATR